MSQHVFLQALNNQPIKRYPVWMMRQAGRYLPEYRQIRATVPDFMSLCKNTELAVAITLQPITRFNFDAAIIFSDILTIPDAMDLGLKFIPGTGPVFAKPITSSNMIDQLANNVIDDLTYVFDAVAATKQALNNQVPLIGFSGSPWTLAAYMVEGSGSVNFAKPLGMLASEPGAMHKLLMCLTKNIIAYCQEQINAGADAIMLFDSHGAKLSLADYSSASLDYLTIIVTELRQNNPNIPIIVYGKVDTARTIKMAQVKPNALGVSHLADLAEVRAKVSKDIVLQGNINPDLMSIDDRDEIISATEKCMRTIGDVGVVNLGHGIKPDAKISQVEAMLAKVRNSGGFDE